VEELGVFILCIMISAFEEDFIKHTSSFKRKDGSHNSQAIFLRSEQVLYKSCASGWKTAKIVVSLTEIFMSWNGFSQC